jgi:hypothetical protein
MQQRVQNDVMGNTLESSDLGAISAEQYVQILSFQKLGRDFGFHSRDASHDVSAPS